MSLITLGLALDYKTEGGLAATDPITVSSRPFFWQQMERTRANFVTLEDLAVIKHARVTLVHTEIRDLPITPITLIASPGSGFRIDVLFATLRAKTSSAAYTNINTTYSALALYWIGDFSVWATVGVVNDTAATPDLTRLSQLLGVTGTDSVRLIPYQDGSDNGWIVPVVIGSGGTDDKALAIAVDNNGSLAFTGGNSANTLQVDVFYTIATAP